MSITTTTHERGPIEKFFTGNSADYVSISKDDEGNEGRGYADDPGTSRDSSLIDLQGQK